MGRKRKEFNKDGTFQTRFRDIWSKTKRTQEDLAKALGVSRPTVVGWLDGKNIPDILSLTKIAQLFNVSADYLLGLSDTVSPDVNARAAVEYTGLSEAAVEWLHIGLDDFECDGVSISEEEKKENLSAASALIQSKAFTKMVQNLNEVSVAAYLERILVILEEHHSECDLPEEDPDFRYAKKEDRDIVIANLIHVLEMGKFFEDESIPDKVNAMDDEELASYVVQALISNREDNELHQFHAAKAFNGYIDQIIKESYQKAEERMSKA